MTSPTDKEGCDIALALDSLRALADRATELERLVGEWEASFADDPLIRRAVAAEARAIELERERDEALARPADAMLTRLRELTDSSREWHERAVRAENAIRDMGDLLFGTWDDDSTFEQRLRKTEAIARAALGETAPSSAGTCHRCGGWADKRYGGEGRYFAYCADCWGALGETAPPHHEQPPQDIPSEIRE